MGRIIVIEDNPVFRDHVCGMLEKAGYKTRTAYDCAGARRLLEELDDGDIIVSDLRLPDGECTEVLERMREAGIRNPFVIMTDYAQVASAVSSMRLGAEDYIPKNLLQEKLLPRINELVRKTERRHTIPILERRSAAFRTIDRRISLVAPTDIGVLILGENGTGKEHVAEKIHAQSTRQKGPFVAIDCGMLTRELAASELFGYEKGAFTDARKEKKGRLELAHGGTLFLDEVGNLSPTAQSKLLTALEKRRIVRRGGTREIPIDVRLICATNADLHTQVTEGTFRQDLFYRINTVEIHIPPLRERGEDIQLLADHFLRTYARKYKKDIRQIARDARGKLQRYAWPGNVRELQHAIERAVVLCNADTLHADDFLLHAPASPVADGETLNLEALERNAVEKAVRLCEGNMSRAAQMLGITRYSLYRKLEKLGL